VGVGNFFGYAADKLSGAFDSLFNDPAEKPVNVIAQTTSEQASNNATVNQQNRSQSSDTRARVAVANGMNEDQHLAFNENGDPLLASEDESVLRDALRYNENRRISDSVWAPSPDIESTSSAISEPPPLSESNWMDEVVVTASITDEDLVWRSENLDSYGNYIGPDHSPWANDPQAAPYVAPKFLDMGRVLTDFTLMGMSGALGGVAGTAVKGGAMLQGAVAGAVGDGSLQLTEMGLYSATDGSLGKSDFDFIEFGTATVGGGLLSGAAGGVAKWWAGRGATNSVSPNSLPLEPVPAGQSWMRLDDGSTVLETNWVATNSAAVKLSGTELGALRGAGLTDNEIAQQIDVLGDVHLFRGTSVGYPGNPVLQKLGITPASTDPLVATVFGLESKAVGGNPILLFGERARFEQGIDLGNVRSVLEREVQVNMAPSEFAKQAPYQVSIDTARQALIDMKVVELPPVINTSHEATRILEATPRLTPEQIREFLGRVRPQK